MKRISRRHTPLSCRHSPCAVAVWSLFISLVAASSIDAADQPFDLVIKSGRVVDGSGVPWYVADLGIRDGKIARIGRIDVATGQRVINAAGLVVAPGFIDMMGQTATPMLDNPASSLNL